MAAGCLLGAVVVFALFWDLRYDDAFITFRYARNLVRGDGFTFNPGERTLGTTTPLFTLIAAALWALFGDAGLPTAAVAVNALALAAQAFFLYLLLRDRLPWTALVVAAVALLGVFGSFPWLSLETNTFAALVLATVWALVRRRPVACGIALGLAFLTRYDAALLVPLVPFWLRREGWRRALTPLAVAAIPVLPWLVFAWIYFGSPLPATLGAKVGATPWRAYLEHDRQLLLRLPGVGASAAASWIAALLTAVGIVHLVRRARELAPLVLFATAQGLVYLALDPPREHEWHLYLCRLTVTLLILLGLSASVERLGDVAALLPTLARRRRLVMAALAVLLIGSQLWQTHRFWRAFRGDYWFGNRFARHTTVATWVRGNVVAHPRFLAPEVGTLGYLTDATMIDPYGLISPIRGFARDPRASRMVELIRQNHPDLALVDSRPVARGLERTTDYRIAKIFSPGSVLLVSGPRVLIDPTEIAGLGPAAVETPAAGGESPR